MSQALFSTLQTSCHRSQTELDLETGHFSSKREQQGPSSPVQFPPGQPCLCSHPQQHCLVPGDG